MATLQSTRARALGRAPTATPYSAGLTCEAVVVHTFNPAALTTADVLELFPQVPSSQITHFEYLLENVAAGNVTFGFMSGEFGSTDAARTCGTELINASATASGTTALSVIAALTTSPASTRGIGMRHSVSTTAGPTVRVTIRIRYNT